MGMPNHLLLVRHGQSVGNVATKAAAAGDLQFYTDSFMTTPGHQWRLTEIGRAQAAAAGAWIRSSVAPRFDRYYVSPFVRTQETAAHLGLPDASWMLNRALRERDWGDIGSLPRSEFESRPEYQRNAVMKRHDPLYWRPPGGESIAGVAEDRVRNVLSTLHRECTGQSVVAVSHGELIKAFRLVIERMDDVRFDEIDADDDEHPKNGEVFHYTRIDPATGIQAARLAWLQRARPVATDTVWRMEVRPFSAISFSHYSNDELLSQVGLVQPLFDNHEQHT